MVNLHHSVVHLIAHLVVKYYWTLLFPFLISVVNYDCIRISCPFFPETFPGTFALAANLMAIRGERDMLSYSLKRSLQSKSMK